MLPVHDVALSIEVPAARLLVVALCCVLAPWVLAEPTIVPEETVVEIEARLGETLHFAIDPSEQTEGSHLRLRVEQLDSDVTLTLRGPDGVEHLADQPLGYHQPELIVVPTAAYALDIDVRVPGRARLHWHVVEPDDRSVEGDLAWSAATDLFRRDSEASLAASKQKFLDAARAYGASSQPEAQARSLLAAGHVAADVGELDEGLDRLRRARELYETAGRPNGAADAWQQIGHVHRLRGEADEARTALGQAFRVSKATGDLRSQARALLNLGFLDHLASRMDEARDTYRRALTLLEEMPDPGLETKLLNNLAGLDFESGRLREAVVSFETLLDSEAASAPRTRARTLTNLAVARRLLGRYQAALDAYDKALETLDGVGEPRLEATIRNNLGFAYLRLGDLVRAEEHLLEALAMQRRAGDEREIATTLNNLGRTAMEADEPATAAAHFQEALELRRKLDDARGQARTLHDLGRLEKDRGQLRQAQDSLEWAMLARRELGDRLGEAASAAELAKVHLASGHPATALDLASRSATHFEQLGSPGNEIEPRLTWMQSLRALGREQEARAVAERALELAESLRLELDSPDLRATRLAVVRELYEEIVDLEVATGHWRRAFAVAERARARAFLDVLHGSRLYQAGLSTHARRQYRRLLEDLAGLRYAMERARRRGQAPPQRLEKAWRELSLEVDRLGHRSARREANELTAAPTLDLDAFQALLDPGTRALVYFLADRRSFVWAIERHSASIHTLPSRDELSELAEAATLRFRLFDPRGTAATRQAAAAAAQAILALALEPAVSTRQPPSSQDASKPEEPKRLVLVPEGALLRLPFAALPVDEERLLVDRFEIAYLPSASALPALRRLAESPSPGGGLALIADPRYRPAGEPDGQAEAPTRLDGSRREAEALATLDGVRAHSLLGPRARRDAVLGDALSAFDYLHFATHATVDASRPELSSLVLSLADAEGRQIDGHVRLADVYGMSLDAALVVLSGCDTGLGRDVLGEGVLGLTRGFFYAGAARVASSLWRVEDDATAELMSRFYRHLLVDRKTPSAALRLAQLSLRAERRYRHPFFWAAFTVQGDWRTPTGAGSAAPP